MTTLQKIREIIIKSNPEIVKLKRGCKIEWRAKNVILIGVILNKNYAGNFLIDTGFTSGNTTTIKKDKIREIIGRPIRLSDVMETIHIKTNVNYAIDIFGYFLIESQMGNYKTIYSTKSWNLEDDNLDNQSKECIDFIHKILT